MKKTKCGDFDLIKFEEGDDITFFAKTINLCLSVDDDGVLYCQEFYKNRAVAYDKSEGVWKRIDLNAVPENAKTLSDEEANEVYKNNPPFDALDEIKKEAENKRLKFWQELRATTKRKVIGWAYPTDKVKVENCDDEKTAALVNDIVEHGYFFTGDCIDLLPIFDDYTCTDFSSRGWGGIIALSKDDGDEMAYTNYAWNGLYEDISSFKYPKRGFYERISSLKIKVDDVIFQAINKNVYTFTDWFFKENPSSSIINSLYFLADYEVMEISPLIEISGVSLVEVTSSQTGEKIDVTCAGYKRIESIEDFNDLYESVNCFGEDSYLINEEKEIIKEKASNGEKIDVIVFVAY